ncbi:NAD(P)-binding domain-containing protein [Peredibacter starrii]|uniref:NAD(P)-binding domain-containing protein n=1 Tax=Peredibacter starrii TaxID=28202 RepID=A0AAX4HLC5_9BACT|nr:NAD(P)-binding domain-containing protein [Peredibacter starrii]WPU64031.1 NAD(P)-binding domain-containing protein [Peredibacter starrii]
MLNRLQLWNFESGKLNNDELASHAFVLRTCQRTLVLAYDIYPFHHEKLPEHALVEGQDAYLFLLETICGLKSKLIGENEIVGQFKEAYKIYASSTLKDTKLLLILEKLFKDAKEIRTQYLIGISQKTYASLTRRHLISRAKAKHVVVIGSGAMAEDLINQFKKKAQITICARNAERVAELANTHGLNIIPWENRDILVTEPFIANTVGANSVLFDEHFFHTWSKLENRLFVDLGAPSTIKTPLTFEEGVVRLDDIFSEGAVIESQKQAQIALAKAAMLSLTMKRQSLFQEKFGTSSTLITPQINADVRYL